MNILIYLAVAALALWSVWYVVRTVRRQLKGDCGCSGDCAACGKTCQRDDEQSP